MRVAVGSARKCTSQELLDEGFGSILGYLEGKLPATNLFDGLMYDVV